MDIIRLFSDGFPLTIERLVFLQQTYTKAISQLSGIYGLRNNEIGIVSGVISGSGGVLSDGVVIYNGEVMEFRGGVSNNNIYVIGEDIVEVPYNIDADNDGNLDPKDSDVVRYMTPDDDQSSGFDPISLDYDLNRLPNIQQLMPKIGEVKMWKGAVNDVPEGWAIMEEMDNRFPIGLASSGGERDVNDEGGNNERVLTKANMPVYNLVGTSGSAGAHRHEYVDGYFIESSPAGQSRQDQFDGYSAESVGSGFRGSGDTDNDNSYIWTKERNTDYQSSHTHGIVLPTGGSNEPIDNKPAFKALYFIEFIGF